jgi:hypothetical protein
MTAIHRIGMSVLAAVAVTAILTLCGLSHGKPAAAGILVGVLVQMKLRAGAKKTI